MKTIRPLLHAALAAFTLTAAWAQAPVWSDNFGLRGPTYSGQYVEGGGYGPPVYAIAETADTVYYGGAFTTFGNKEVSSLVAVNKASGAVTDIGAGLGSGAEVQALAVVGSDLYAGSGGLKKWNGSTWSTVSGVGYVYALAVSGSELLIAAESFTAGSGIAGQQVAKWNGTTLTGLGATDGNVLAIAAQGGNVYIAGGFSTVGALEAQGVAKWNGSVWTAMGAGLPGEVVAIAANATTVMAGGEPMSIGGDPRLLFEWNGSAWVASEQVPSNDGLIRSIVAHGASAFIVGGTFYGSEDEHVIRLHLDPGEGPGYWRDYEFNNDGMGTVGFGRPSPPSEVTAVSAAGTAVYIGGAFTQVRADHPDYEYAAVSAINAAKWTGTTWASVVGGDAIAATGEFAGRVSAILDDGDDVIVAGTFAFAGGAATYGDPSNQRGIARWNKTTRAWTPLDPDGYLYGSDVSELAKVGGTLYAVLGDGGQPNNVVRMSEPSPGFFEWESVGQVNGEIFAMVEKGGELHIAGAFTNIAGVPANSIAKWNGTAWSALGTGITGPSVAVYAMAVQGSDLIAAGYFNTAGGSAVTHVAKWSGSAWSAMGTGDIYTLALAVFGGEVHSGSSDGVKKWTGSAWTSVGGATSSYIAAMAVGGGKLYVGGYFTDAGGVPANNVASWDGTAWSALGSGIIDDSGNGVLAVATDGTRAYFGGDFHKAGGKISGLFAEYGPPPVTFGPNVKISDEFDDGNPATNTTGVGNGFVSRGQVASTESGGFLNLNNASGASTRVYTSNTADALNPFSANVTSTTLRYTYGAVNHGTGAERSWLGYRISGATSDVFYPLGNGSFPKVQGLYVSILQQNADTAYPRHGNLVAVSNTGVEKKLATWDWQNVNALSGVVVTLTTTPTSYALSFSGASGAVPTNVTGALSGTLSGLGPITTNFDTGVFSQFFAGTGTGVTVDSVLVTVVPPPSVTAPIFSVLSPTEVILGGNATGANGAVTARGVVYSLASENANPAIGGANVTQVAAGSGTGVFSVNLSGLFGGETYVFRSYVIDSSGTVYTSTSTFTTPPDGEPITMRVAATGAPVPGAGVAASGIPAGAVWTAFGTPAVNDATQVAFVGSYKVGAVVTKGIFVDDTLVVGTGAPAPGLAGVTIKSFNEPLIDSAGFITFRATLGGTGVTTGNDGAFLTNAGTGVLRILAREGDQAVGTPAGAVWKTLINVAIPGEPLGFLFTGQLLTGLDGAPGPGGVTTANDMGLWTTDSSGSVRLLFREGDSVGGKTLKTFQVLTVVSGSQGSARSFNGIGTVTWRAAFTDNSVEILTTQVQ